MHCRSTCQNFYNTIFKNFTIEICNLCVCVLLCCVVYTYMCVCVCVCVLCVYVCLCVCVCVYVYACTKYLKPWTPCDNLSIIKAFRMFICIYVQYVHVPYNMQHKSDRYLSEIYYAIHYSSKFTTQDFPLGLKRTWIT